MNRITRHDRTSPRNADVRPQALRSVRHLTSLRRQRAHTTLAAAGVLGTVALAAVVFGSSLAASAAPAQAARGAAGLASAGLQTAHISARASTDGDGRLEATLTSSAVSVTPGLGMVELILSGSGTVRGFGSATQVVGVVEDKTASPCGAGGASDSAERRIVMQGGVLELHEVAKLCMTASGPQVTGTYRVDGHASTGIFAGARGTGHITSTSQPATKRSRGR